MTGNTYLHEYQDLKGLTNRVKSNGGYTGSLIIPQLTDQKIAPVLQSVSDEVLTTVFQDRFGRVIIYGPYGPKDIIVPYTLNDRSDPNVSRMILKESFSKVFSEVKVLYTGGEGNAAYNDTSNPIVYNSEPSAKLIRQPEIRTFQTSTIVTIEGAETIDSKKAQYAASIMRKSNQNLAQVVVHSSRPFYVTDAGLKIPYEVNQIWNVSSPSRGLNRQMRIAGIGYTQDDQGLAVELMFILKDSLT